MNEDIKTAALVLYNNITKANALTGNLDMKLAIIENALSAQRQFPDIGPDPLRCRDQVDSTIKGSLERTGKASAVQQKEVPDQTALVWRIDIERLRGEVIWLHAFREHAMPRFEELDKIKAGGVLIQQARMNTDSKFIDTCVSLWGRRGAAITTQDISDFREALEKALAESRKGIPTGVFLVVEERLRQISEKGYTAEHDDQHTGRDLAINGCPNRR